MTSIRERFELAERNTVAMRTRALQNFTASGGVMGAMSGDVANYYGAAAAGSSSMLFDAAAQQQFPRLYRAAMRDHQYAAIRPTAIKVADQTIRVGRRQAAKATMPSGLLAKQLDLARKFAPDFVVKKIDDRNVELIDTHPILDLFEGSHVQPNKYMSVWDLLYCTAYSLEAVGEAIWWCDFDGESKSIWYWPRSWIRPIPYNGDAYGLWKIDIPGVPSDAFPPISGDDIIPFRYPNPADPTRSHSPTAAQSRSINTDDQIQDTQLASMKNAMRPSLGVVIGDVLPSPNGGQVKPELTAEQRKQIIEALRLAYRGAMHTGDPIILDGLISDIKQIFASPGELDYPQSSTIVRDRIRQGYGVNPFIMGQVEGSNRATAHVAMESHYSLKVNPICTLISKQLTRRIGPRFSAEGEKLLVWLTHAVSSDEDLVIRQVDSLSRASFIRPSEARAKYGLPADPELDALWLKKQEAAANPPTPPGMGPAASPAPAKVPTRPAGRQAGGKKSARRISSLDDEDGGAIIAKSFPTSQFSQIEGVDVVYVDGLLVKGYEFALRFDPIEIDKAYNPNQPRHPAGTPLGGRWISKGDAATVATRKVSPQSQKLIDKMTDEEKAESSEIRRKSMAEVANKTGNVAQYNKWKETIKDEGKRVRKKLLDSTYRHRKKIAKFADEKAAASKQLDIVHLEMNSHYHKGVTRKLPKGATIEQIREAEQAWYKTKEGKKWKDKHDEAVINKLKADSAFNREQEKQRERVLKIIQQPDSERLQVSTSLPSAEKIAADPRSFRSPEVVPLQSSSSKQSIDEATEFVSRVSSKSIGRDGQTSFETCGIDGKYEQRSFYEYGRVVLGTDASTATAVHEIGHHIETMNGGVGRMAQGFLHSRTSQDTPFVMYRDRKPTEYGREDDFAKTFGDRAAYVGKHYKNGDTEIISMGLEQLYRDAAGFAKADPEYFNLMIAVIRGRVPS
jgi:phage portal protein BeeE